MLKTLFQTRPVGMFAALMLTLMAGTGCKTDPSAQRVKDQREAQAARDSFESQREPEINVNTRHAAGRLAEASNNLPLAVQQYEEALKIDEKHLPSLYRLGVVHAKMTSYDNAVEAWKKYIKLTDGSGVGYSNLGYTYELAGRLGDAETTYKAGIALDPDGEPCRVNYGLMLARLGRASEATLQLQTVLAPAEVHYNLASVYEQLGRKEQAKVEYNKSIELDPELQDARTRLAALE